MRYFCTYFDHRYLTRGLALYSSLRHWCPDFHIWILCLDAQCYDVLKRLGLSHATLIALDALEQNDQALLATKETRTLVEYYFTCTPALPLYVLHRFAQVDLITYVDADLFFFSSLEPIFEEIGAGSVAIIEHRFSPALTYLQGNGQYNVGWLSFRRDANGLACLQWWRERCLEWCYDRVENGRFADQKYLDEWPNRFSGVVIIQNVGVGVAPWNLANYRIGTDGVSQYIDDQPLIMFHFHGLQQMTSWLFDTGLHDYRVKPSNVIKETIYRPYARRLIEASREIYFLRQTLPRPGRTRFQNWRSPLHRLTSIAHGGIILVRDLLLGQCVLIFN